MIGKINTSIWFCCMKKNLMEEVLRPHTRQNPKKAHLTGELVVA